MADVAGALGKEIGAGPLKLPIWGWLIAGVGGVYVAKKITAGRAASSAAATSSGTTANQNSGLTGLPGGGVLTLGSNGAVNVPGGALSPTAPSITDNNAWRIAAEGALVTGGYDALLAASAIDKYLNGTQLTPQEAGAVQYALTRIGPTPMPVPPPISTPVPVTPKPPATPPPKVGSGPGTLGQQTSPNTAKPSLPTNHDPGEAFVDFANDPFSRGTWWLTNWGGVYAVGGAKYKGAPITSRVSKQLGAGPAGQSFVSIEPYGTGYRIHDNRTDTGDYTYP